jgi:circadian clock protein KaiB
MPPSDNSNKRSLVVDDDTVLAGPDARCVKREVRSDTLSGKLALTLYVSGKSAHSEFVESTLKALLEGVCPGRYALEVVDLYDDIERAESEHIFCTPTLVRTAPLPRLALIGNLSAKDKVCSFLGLCESGERI